jgi:hypothetical protein
MEVKIKLMLERMAKKKGGDRYQGGYDGENLTIYLPQSISRPEGSVKQELIMTISDSE